MRGKRFLPLLLCAATVAACSDTRQNREQPATSSAAAPPPAGQPGRKYLLERVDDAAVVQVYADGFATLPLREKILIWHLYQAAIAGRDIFYDQKHRHALAMRRVLEAIVSHRQGVDTRTLAEIDRYTKLFWINSGPYNNLTARKFVMKVPPEALADAAHKAASAGATFPTAPGESLDALLTRLRPMFFDPDVDPIVTNRTPGPGKDMLASSANNLYSGVTLADLRGFTERYGLNSRLVKAASPPASGGRRARTNRASANGRLVEEVYRIDGRYGPQIAAIVRHLEAAIPYASDPTAAALRALIAFYRSGDRADREKYDIAWVRDTQSPVDTVNGFVEVYLDPRGIKGAWEGIVDYVNQEKTARIRRLADNAQWFEDHMPYDAKYRKANVKGIVANAIDVVIETGDAGPVTPIGINLPNDARIREQYGSKSVTLANVVEANDNATPASLRTEFSWSAEEAQRANRFSLITGELHVDMHEVIGHASGQQAAGFKGTPEQALKEQYSALEEARADLVALYFIGDAKLAELGIVPAGDRDAMARAQYEAYARQAITQLRRARGATHIEEAHMRNRQMIVLWMMANTKAIAARHRDGKTFYEVVDPQAFRDGIARLLADVQRIKSEGDYAAARQLLTVTVSTSTRRCATRSSGGWTRSTCRRTAASSCRRSRP
jgi:dipeptidyl-peptidase-3